MYQNSTVRIHSNIADAGLALDRRGYSAVALWYWCRCKDSTGSGRVVFNLSEPAAGLDKQISTIKRYLVDGKKLKFFREVKRNGNTITVYLSSRDEVAICNGLMGLGTFVEIPDTEIKNIKFWATQAKVQALQGASRWQAKLSCPIPKQANIPQPEDVLIESSLSSVGASEIIHRGKKCTFVTERFKMFGVSQSCVAKELGRHISTIQRRLSNSYRLDRGIAPIQKTRLVQRVEESLQKPIRSALQSGELMLDLNQYFVYGGVVYKSGCNVYAREFDILSGKAAKFFYRRKVRRILQGD